MIPPTDEVYLWLGANVMLSYPIDEAENMLEGKLSGAQHTLGNCDEDLDFLREQITVSLGTYREDSKLINPGDTRSRHSTCVQLGCDNEEEREGRGWRFEGKDPAGWLRQEDFHKMNEIIELADRTLVVRRTLVDPMLRKSVHLVQSTPEIGVWNKDRVRLLLMEGHDLKTLRAPNYGSQDLVHLGSMKRKAGQDREGPDLQVSRLAMNLGSRIFALGQKRIRGETSCPPKYKGGASRQLSRDECLGKSLDSWTLVSTPE